MHELCHLLYLQALNVALAPEDQPQLRDKQQGYARNGTSHQSHQVRVASKPPRGQSPETWA